MSPTWRPFSASDGVCINQGDLEEKNQQVQLMGTIYSKASLVISWLGCDYNGKLEFAVRAIQTFAREADSSNDWPNDLLWIRKYPWLTVVDNEQNDIPNETWNSLKSFFSDPYWTRIWILQEMVLAQNLTIMVGSHLIPFKNLESSVQLIEGLGSRSTIPLGSVPYELRYFLSSPGYIDISGFRQINEFQQYAKTITQMQDAEKLEAIFSAWPRRSTRPEDKVFALQGLLGNFIIPDYTKDPSEVYSDIASKWIMATGDLDILRFSGQALGLPDLSKAALASWVPNWHAISFIDRWQPFPPAYLNLENGLDNFCSFPAQVDNQCRLNLKGCICDTVTEIEPGYDLKSFNLQQFYEKYSKRDGETKYPTGIPKLQAILRTLVTEDCFRNQIDGSIPEDKSVQGSFLTILQALNMHEGSLERDTVDTIRLHIQELGIAFKNHIVSFFAKVLPEAAMNEDWLSDEKVVREVIDQMPVVRQCLLRCFDDGRRLFHSSSGYLGIGPSGMRTGDVVSMLQSCPYPVALRRTGTQYTHMGTVFVLGFMGGEIGLEIERGLKELQDFIIQ